MTIPDARARQIEDLKRALTAAEQERDEAVKRVAHYKTAICLYPEALALAKGPFGCEPINDFWRIHDSRDDCVGHANSEINARKALAWLSAEARAAAMEAALEEISGHAPVKTPPDYATSSDTGEAFDDGYSRGVWEMGQIADAALAPQAEAGEG